MSKKKPHRKPHGHYCRVCGEHKANEKFSGKGHAAHICKKCAALPVAERNEQLTLRKIEGMAFRYLSEAEIKWLRDRMKDRRPEIQEAAKVTHEIKFPRYERNMIKKGLTAFSLELFIHGDIWNEWGDEVSVHMLMTLDDTGVIRRIDYDAPENEREAEIVIDRQDARRFLKSVIHEYDALFWGEDLSDAGPDEYDPYLDILPEYRPDFDEHEEFDIDFDPDGEMEADKTDAAPAAAEQAEHGEARHPLWSLRLELNSGEERVITFYNQMHNGPQELFWSLIECFEPDDDDDYS